MNKPLPVSSCRAKTRERERERESLSCHAAKYATSLALAGPSGIRAGWGIETNGRLVAERPPASAWAPLGVRAATLTPFVPFVQHWTLLSSLSYNQAYMPGRTFGSKTSLAHLHCTKWVDDQHRLTGLEPWFVPDLSAQSLFENSHFFQIRR